MIRFKYIAIFLLLAFTGVNSSLWAQTLPAQFCEQAQTICGNPPVFTENIAYSSGDVALGQITPGLSCLGSGDLNGIWYTITPSTGGLLNFSITPNVITEDYDWAVYDLSAPGVTCSDIATNAALEISCNYSGLSGVTGPNGLPGAQNELPVPIVAGGLYLVFVSNFSKSVNGYTIDLSASTANIQDVVPPKLSYVQDVSWTGPPSDPAAPPVNCGSTQLNLTFSKDMDCGTVQASDFVLTGPSPTGIPNYNYPVVSVLSVKCTPGVLNGGKTFVLTVDQPMVADGQYTITVVGEIKDICGNSAFTGDIDFQLLNNTVSNAGPDQTICKNQTTAQLNGGGNGDFFIWYPTTGLSDPTIPNPIANPTSTTNYILTCFSLGCAGKPDTTTVFVKEAPKAPLAGIAGNLEICKGEQAVIVAYGGTEYWWSASNVTTDTIKVSPVITTNYKMVAYNGTDCPGDTIPFTVVVKPTPSTQFSLDAFGCQFVPTTIEYTGGSPENTLFQWDFDGGYVVSGSLPGKGPHEVVWFSPSQPDTHKIVLTVSKDGCSATDSSNIIVNPQALIQVQKKVHNLCAGANVNVQLVANTNLSSNSNCAFFWAPAEGLNSSLDQSPFASPTKTTTYSVYAMCGGCLTNIDTVRVNILPRPIIDFDTNVVDICKGSAGLQLNALVTGGVFPYGYSWEPVNFVNNPNIPNPFVFPDVTTSFTLKVKDSLGCDAAEAKILVNVNDLPIANAGPDLYLCNAQVGDTLYGSVVNEEFGGYEFYWSPGAGLNDSTIQNPFVSVDTTTVYSLIVKSKRTGCWSASTNLDTVSTVTVYRAPLPVPHAGPDMEICFGGSVQIGDIPTNVGPNYTYLWQPATGLSDPTLQRPIATPEYTTVYFLKIFSNGCESVADSMTVTVNAIPTVILGQPGYDVCPFDSVRLESIVAGGAEPYTYLWAPAAGLSDPTSPNPKASPTETTTYTLTVSAKGCPVETPQTTVVTVPKFPTFQADRIKPPLGWVLCAGENQELPGQISDDRPPIKIHWSPGATLSDSTIINPIASPDQSTRYTLHVTIGNCTLTDYVDFIVQPPMVLGLAIERDTICIGDQVYLEAYGGIGSPTYVWEPAEGLSATDKKQIIANPTKTTTYTLTVYEAGCSADTVFTISVFPRPTPAFNHTSPFGCENMEVSFIEESIGVEGWYWDFGDGGVSNEPNPTYVYTKAGNYLVTLTVGALGGCKESVSASSLVYVAPSVTAAYTSLPGPIDVDTLILPNSTVQFTDSSVGAVRWLWSFGDSAFSDLQNPTHTFAVAGLYSVLLIAADEAGCSDSSVVKKYLVVEPDLNIPNVFTPNGDGFNDFWKVKYGGVESFGFKIFDRWGVQAYESQNPDNGWNGNTSNGSEYPAGVYFYDLRIGSRRYKGNIVLTR